MSLSLTRKKEEEEEIVQTNEMKVVKTTEEGKVLKPLHVGALPFHWPSMHLRIIEPFIWNPSLQEKKTNALCLISLFFNLPSRGACKGTQDANEVIIMLSITHNGVLIQHNTFWITRKSSNLVSEKLNAIFLLCMNKSKTIRDQRLKKSFKRKKCVVFFCK